MSSTGSTSQHYLGERGEEYFAYQREVGLQGARLNRHKFQPYIAPKDIVLDVGCGGGYLLRDLECSHRIGLEVNPAAAAVAISQGIECHLNLGQLADETVDVAISHHALEHTLSPLTVLTEIRAKMKPGARLILVVPLDDWRTQRVFDPQERNHHLFTWTPQNLGNLLTEAGFKISERDVRIRRCAWPPSYSLMARVLPEKVFRAVCACFAILVRRRELRAFALR